MMTPGKAAPQPSIELAEELATALRDSLPSQVEAAALGFPSKLPFKLISSREPLLLRIVDLAEAAASLHRAGHYVGAVILARAVMESTALLYALEQMVSRVVQSREVDAFARDIMRMLFGSRNKRTPVGAINVLDQVDLMDKKFKGLRSWYEDLSEVAHPNYAGVIASYGKVDQEKYVLHLKPRDWSIGVVAPVLCSCLEISRHLRQQIDEALDEFSGICHDLAAEPEPEAST